MIFLYDIFIKITFIYLYTCTYLCVPGRFLPCVCECEKAQRPEEYTVSPRPENRSSCKVSCLGAEIEHKSSGSKCSLTSKPPVYFIGYFINISNIIPLLSFLFTYLLSHSTYLPASMRMLPHPPTHSCPHCPCIPILLVIEPTQDEEAPLPLMLDRAILYYVCNWSHGSLHV